MHLLWIEDESGRRTSVPVELGTVTLGRDVENVVRLNERNVSRRHARIATDGEGVVAEDLGSANGVYLNDVRILAPTRLHEGDRIRVGDFSLQLSAPGLMARDDEDTEPNGPPTSEVTPVRTQRDRRRDDDDERFGIDEESERAEPTAIINLDSAAHRSVLRPAAKPSTVVDPAELLCVSSEHAGDSWSLDATELIIGRGPGCDIRIDHRSVSTRHAKLVAIGTEWHVRDLGSANGTVVNGESYGSVALRGGDLVELGYVKLRYLPTGHAYTPNPIERSAIEEAAMRRGLVPRSRTRLPWLIAAASIALASALAVASIAYVMSQRVEIRSAPVVAPAVAPDIVDDFAPESSAQRSAQPSASSGGASPNSVIVTPAIAPDTGSGLPSLETLEPAEPEPAVSTPVSAPARERVRERRKTRRAHSNSKAQETAAGRSPVGSNDEGPDDEGLDDDGPGDDARADREAPAQLNPEALRKRATAAISAGDTAEGIALLNQCLRADRRHCKCHRDLGIAYAKLQRYDRTARHYRTYIRLCPDTPERAQIEAHLQRFAPKDN